MSYTGKVQNGVVVLPPEIKLPEGTEVKVETLGVRKTWPANFFDSIHITDPTFVRSDQGKLPAVKNL